MTSSEKRSGSLIHIAGYVESENKSHPEFWFVRNIHGINSTSGVYENIDETFEISEDFWNRDCPKAKLMELFQDENAFAWQYYVNRQEGKTSENQGQANYAGDIQRPEKGTR